MDETERYFKKLYKELGVSDLDSWVKKRTENIVGKKTLKIAKGLMDMKGLKILEVGCGWGNVLLPLSEEAKEVWGVEPDKEKIEIAKKYANKENIKIFEGYGENMPFNDEEFDVVIVPSVIEHTQDPVKVYDEIHRVLKPKGKLINFYPNYASFFEHHYKVRWFPFFNKFTGSIYLRLIGRNPAFLQNEINFITYAWSDRELAKKFKLLKDVSAEEQREIIAKRTGIGRIISSILFKLKMQPSVIIQLWETKPKQGLNAS